MSHQFGIKKRFSLSVKIAMLPVLGLLGLFLVKGMDIYVSSRGDKAFAMGQYGSDIAWYMTERTLLETEYLNNPQDQLLKRIVAQNKKIDDILLETKKLDTSKEMQLLIRQIETAATAHQKKFEEAAESVRNLSESKATLVSLFNKSDSILRDAIENIIEEETELTIIYGLDLPEKKVALRSGFKEIMGFTATAMLNLNELLFLQMQNALKRQVKNYKKKRKSRLIIFMVLFFRLMKISIPNNGKKL